LTNDQNKMEIDALSNIILVLSITSIIFLLFFPMLSDYIYLVLSNLFPEFDIIETQLALPGIRTKFDIVGYSSYFLFILLNIIVVLMIIRGENRKAERNTVMLSIVIASLISLPIFIFFMFIIGTLINSFYYSESEFVAQRFLIENLDYSMTMLPLIIIFILSYMVVLILINNTVGERLWENQRTKMKMGKERREF